MTRVFLALFILGSNLAAPALAADCGGMPVGFHEFAIFGGGKHVFISHYPMFSSIHAYQVLLEVELSGDDHDAARKFLDHQAAHPELRYTFSPYRKTVPAADRVKDQDDWVLPEKSRVGSSINGDIHYREGTGDTTLDFNVGAKIVSVIQNRLMVPGESRPKSLTYILFGDSTAPFLAHYISAPPNPGEQVADFDQILQVSSAGASALSASNKLFAVVDRPNEKSSKLTAGETVSLVSTDGEHAEVKVVSEVFAHTVGTDR